jgi:hypothetical protein
VLIGDPIPVAGLGSGDREALRERTRTAILALKTRVLGSRVDAGVTGP